MSLDTLSLTDESHDLPGPADTPFAPGIWPRRGIVWLLVIWMGLLILRPWERLFPSWQAIYPEKIISILTLSAIMLKGLPRLIISTQTLGLLAWLGAITFSALTAQDSELAWQAWYQYVVLFAFYFAILSIVREPSELFFVVISFITWMGIYLTKSEWEYIFNGAHLIMMGVPRLQGIDVTYSHPNAVGGSTVLTLPFVYCLWRVRHSLTQNWPNSYRSIFPAALVVYFLVAVAAIILTNSRSGLLGLGIFLMLGAAAQASKGRLLKGLGVACLLLGVVWIMMPEESRGRFRNIWDPSSGPAAESAHASAEGRWEGLHAGLVMFEKFPLSGVGPGNFIAYRVPHVDGIKLVAHNNPGQVLGELGLLGGLTFVFFVAGAFVNRRATLRLTKNSVDPLDHLLAELATACRNSVLLILVAGLFGNTQDRCQLYWVAAFGLLTRVFAEQHAPVNETMFDLENEPVQI